MATSQSTHDVEELTRRWLGRWETSSWESLDFETAYDQCAPDVKIGVNGPVPLAEGVAVLRMVDSSLLSGIERYRVEIVNIASVGNTVFVERVDHFTRDGVETGVPVCGVLEFNDDGLLAVLRDYFDPSKIADLAPGGLPEPPKSSSE